MRDRPDAQRPSPRGIQSRLLLRIEPWCFGRGFMTWRKLHMGKAREEKRTGLLSCFRIKRPAPTADRPAALWVQQSCAPTRALNTGRGTIYRAPYRGRDDSGEGTISDTGVQN